MMNFKKLKKWAADFGFVLTEDCTFEGKFFLMVNRHDPADMRPFVDLTEVQLDLEEMERERNY